MFSWEAHFVHIFLAPVAWILAGCGSHMVPCWIEATCAVVVVGKVISMRMAVVPVSETFVGAGVRRTIHVGVSMALVHLLVTLLGRTVLSLGLWVLVIVLLRERRSSASTSSMFTSTTSKSTASATIASTTTFVNLEEWLRGLCVWVLLWCLESLVYFHCLEMWHGAWRDIDVSGSLVSIGSHFIELHCDRIKLLLKCSHTYCH